MSLISPEKFKRNAKPLIRNAVRAINAVGVNPVQVEAIDIEFLEVFWVVG